MYDKVISILKSVIDIDENKVSPDSKLIADLGLNSFDIINIIVAFEDEFDIEVPEKDIRKLVTLKDAADYLEKKVNR